MIDIDIISEKDYNIAVIEKESENAESGKWVEVLRKSVTVKARLLPVFCYEVLRQPKFHKEHGESRIARFFCLERRLDSQNVFEPIGKGTKDGSQNRSGNVLYDR